MRSVPASLLFLVGAFGLSAGLLLLAMVAPLAALGALPALVILLMALLLYEFPIAAAALLVGSLGLALDLQLDMLASSGAAGGAGTLGASVVKLVPYALAGVLILRYGFSAVIPWTFLAFTAIAAVSIVVLPMGRVADTGEMVRSYIGSVAPFVLTLAHAPRHIWAWICKAVIFIPLMSAGISVFTWAVGFYPSFDTNWRFQGLHSAPYLAGFCLTAIFAATLEYLRTFRTRWLILGGAVMAVLLASQARAPMASVVLFLFCVLVFSGSRVFPAKRKIDLLMGGMLPALMLFGPLVVLFLDRALDGAMGGGGMNLSGRDVIWPYFVQAIEARPLFGYGLGAGKLIVDPLDPQIRLIQSNAAHNEYLRLSVDAGIVGCTLIIGSIVAWVWGGTRRVAPADRLVIRCALAGALLHTGFDNTLIATTAAALFVWFTAALARARAEAAPRHGAR